MSEELVIRHCSPTLAGIKTGNLFTCRFEQKEEINREIRKLNRILVKKGLRVLPLRFSGDRALIYIYRPLRLTKDLKDHTACRLLKERGYIPEDIDQCIVHLVERLKENEEFPHEIGLFLGYPPEDVCGFIEHKEEGCKCTGCWKVYGDVDAAQKEFTKFKKCTDIYCTQYAKGKTIERLTVAV